MSGATDTHSPRLALPLVTAPPIHPRYRPTFHLTLPRLEKGLGISYEMVDWQFSCVAQNAVSLNLVSHETRMVSALLHCGFVHSEHPPLLVSGQGLITARDDRCFKMAHWHILRYNPRTLRLPYRWS